MSALAKTSRSRRDEADDPAAVIVRHVVRQMRKTGRRTPAEADVLSAITDVTVDDTTEGSSTLTIHLHDENFELLRSGFFDANRDGKLDRIEVNYPNRSRYWWRLTQIEVERQDQRVIQMIFMERVAVQLMELTGPLKANRAKVTRAEFLKSLTDRLSPSVNFHSRELHRKQPIEREDGSEKPQSEADRKKNKDPGIHRQDRMTVKGSRATSAQLRTAERMLDVAHRLDAGRIATLAMLYAAIGESSLGAETGVNSSGYGGILGVNANIWAGHLDDPELQARYFLIGGRGFQGGGAIHLAQNGVTNPAQIAVEVERPSVWPDNAYARQVGHENFLGEAEEMLKAYGGGSDFGATYYRKQYNFQIGGPDNPREDYWEGSHRIADEVDWAYFIDGQDVYYDAETTLIRQKVTAIIEREDEAVVTWSYTWDARHICTECEIEITCDVFEFRAGEVFRLKDFGAASTGSTADLPGRWLIASSERSVYATTTRFTLKQPEKANREPLSELAQRREPGQFSLRDVGIDDPEVPDSVVRAYGEALRIHRKNLPYVWGGGHEKAGFPNGGGYDCSGYVVAILAAGGMGFHRGGGTATSGALESWGVPGEGRYFTVWASAPHVWIEWHIRGAADRADTSPHGDGPNGPHLRWTDREHGGFTPRHWSENS